jgi:hypothetical protein
MNSRKRLGATRILPIESFVSEIFVDDHYADDGVRFATEAEALSYGATRTNAAYRATSSGEPFNYRWTDGRLAPAEPADDCKP